MLSSIVFVLKSNDVFSEYKFGKGLVLSEWEIILIEFLKRKTENKIIKKILDIFENFFF